MIQVHTRDGIFGPGGYGGGLFDGSNMGFGGLGAAGCGESSGCGIAGLTAPTQWTIGPNEWPSTVSQAVVKSTTRWKELPAANPGMKLVTINGQANLSPWKVGQVVNLPASWVTAAAPPPSGGGGGISTTLSSKDISMIQEEIASTLQTLGYEGIPVDGKMSPLFCGALKLLASMQATLSRDDFPDFFDDMTQFGAALDASCRTVGAVQTPKKQSGGQAVPPSQLPAGIVCEFEFGTKAPEIVKLQHELNRALDAAGYEPIAATGIYDPATCGGIFTLSGSFHPDPTSSAEGSNCSKWYVPLDCPDKVLPKKKGEPAAKTSASMAWMLGGLIGAAALAGLYVSMKKK